MELEHENVLILFSFDSQLKLGVKSKPVDKLSLPCSAGNMAS